MLVLCVTDFEVENILRNKLKTDALEFEQIVSIPICSKQFISIKKI